MSAHVTIGYDGSEPARDALALGRMLAEALGAPVRVASIYPFVAVESYMGGASYETLSRQEAAERLRDAEALLGEGAGADFQMIPAHSPAGALAATAEQDRGILVVGSNHRGALRRVLLGGTGTRLVRRARVPVVVAPRGLASREPRHPALVGVALDLDDDAHDGLVGAVALAERLSARLRVLHVLHLEDEVGRPLMWPTQDPQSKEFRELREHARARLDAAVREAAARVPADGRLLEGSPARALADAGHDLDLLAVGPRGSWLHALLAGSVTRRLAQAPPCPLIVMPVSERLGPLLEPTAAAKDGPVRA
jgi:nucleotide-binding universal stress UspA family protein